jgi:hypothetical protein
VPRSYTLPDGTVIEVTYGDSYAGPDNCFSDQKVSSTAAFWRLPGTTWIRSNFRGMHRLVVALEAAKSLDAFLTLDREAE